MKYFKEEKEMGRNFYDVVGKITTAMPELKEDLDFSIGFWAPEIQWFKLSEYVNDNVAPDSSDPRSIAVYAALCDVPEENMKQDFIAKGY